MGRVILYIATSLDGYIARENGDVDWLPTLAESGYAAFYKSIDTVLMGKTTFDQVLTFGEYPYKDKNSIVFTRNNQNKGGDVEFVSDIEKFVNERLPKEKGNIWLVGGAEIISSFFKHGIIDEIILSVIPIILGKGIPLFKNIEMDTKLEFMKTEKYDQLVDLYYKVLK